MPDVTIQTPPPSLPGQETTGPTDPATIAKWYQASPYSQTPPTTNPGLIASQTQAPPVTAPNTTGSVAQIDPNQFNPSTPVNAKMTPNLGTATIYNANQTTGTNWNVSAPQTVAGQVSGLIASNSPLMQQAATQAAQQQNERGLLNSSMAIGAGQAAVIGAALPIAQQDATTNANAANFNAGVANQTGQFNTTAQNAANQFNTGALNTQSGENQQSLNTASQVNTAQANALQSQLLQQRGTVAQANQAALNQATAQSAQMSLQSQTANQGAAVQQSATAYDNAVKIAMANTTAAGALQIQQIDAGTRTNLAQIQAKYNVQMQTSSSMSATYQGFIQQSAAILSDANLDAAGKQTAINNLTTEVNNSMQLQSSISGLNLGSLIDPKTFGVINDAAPVAPSYVAGGTNTGFNGGANTGTDQQGTGG